MDTKVVRKSLAGVQDLLQSPGFTSQNRGGQVVDMLGLHAYAHVESAGLLPSIPPSITENVAVVQDGFLSYYQYTETAGVQGIASTVATGVWVLVKLANAETPAYNRVYSFEDGARLDYATDALYSRANKRWYIWTGTLPKLVPPGSTPASTGGVAPGAWEDVGNAGLIDVLSASNGYSKIGQYENMAALRKATFSVLGQQIMLRCHTNAGEGGGAWYVHALTNDSSYVDDNGCQIITESGQVLRRANLTYMTIQMFGVKGGEYIDTALANMFKASRTFRLTHAYVHRASNAQPYYLAGGLTFDLTDGLNFYLIGEGDGELDGTVVRYTGNGIGLWWLRRHGTGAFWVTGGIKGFTFVGYGAPGSGVTNNPNVGAVPVRISDLWHATHKHMFYQGFTGIGASSMLSVYNNTAWTEGIEIDDTMVRSGGVGVRFHKNTEAGSTATNSFFRTYCKLDFNAGVSGSATQAIVLGDGTEAGGCVMYGHHIELTFWASAGAWHNGINVTNYSEFAKDGKVVLISDGYGISRSTVPSAEVMHLIRVGNTESYFRSTVENRSDQITGWNINFANLVYQSLMYTNGAPVYPSSRDALPNLMPTGLSFQLSGTFTQAERIAGKIVQLNALQQGMTLRVRLTSWNDQYDSTTQEWKVIVRGTDLPCIVTPVAGGSSLALTKDGDGKVTDVVASAGRLWLGPTATPYALTLRNSKDDNSLGYELNSGRKLRFVLPPNPAATAGTPYSVTIEVM